MTHYSFLKRRNLQTGLTFVEVLIALFIIVTGILGAVAMQATAKQSSFDAMQRSLASSLAEDLIARMRATNPANLAGYDADDYGTGAYPAGVRCDTSDANCGVAAMTANDQFEWELALMGGDVTLGGENVGGLVGATGCVNVVGNNVTVVVSWQGRTDIVAANLDADCGANNAKRRQVMVRAFIL